MCGQIQRNAGFVWQIEESGRGDIYPERETAIFRMYKAVRQKLQRYQGSHFQQCIGKLPLCYRSPSA